MGSLRARIVALEEAIVEFTDAENGAQMLLLHPDGTAKYPLIPEGRAYMLRAFTEQLERDRASLADGNEEAD